MVEDAGQDVRSAARSAGPVDQSISDPADDGTVERVEEDVVGQAVRRKDLHTRQKIHTE